jgi:hypothetical protein
VNRSSLIAILLLALAPHCSVTGQSTSVDPIRLYYPLAKGSSWKFQVKRPGQRTASVEWRVTDVQDTQTGPVYQVWPFPSQADDEAMRLRFSKQVLEEASTGTILLRFPTFIGDSWSNSKPNQRTFRVVTAGKPCQTVTIKSEDCIVIEDEDAALSFRTQTTYAKGVGPIRYVYYSKKGAADIPIQTVDLISFRVGRR